MASVRPQFDVDRDLRTVEAMASRLTPYVYENQLYGNMPGDLAKLTVGGMLMRIYRLNEIADTLNTKQQEILRKANDKLDSVRREWAVAYEGKLEQEFRSRVTAMNHYINECVDNPRSCRENYPSEAEKRTILQHLGDEALERNIMTDEVKGALSSLDNKLHRYLEPGPFIWDPRLEPAYPKDTFWFLYIK
jgi:hypothetical protein